MYINVCCESINPYRYFSFKGKFQNFTMYIALHLDNMVFKNVLWTEQLSVYMPSKALWHVIYKDWNSLTSPFHSHYLAINPVQEYLPQSVANNYLYLSAYVSVTTQLFDCYHSSEIIILPPKLQFYSSYLQTNISYVTIYHASHLIPTSPSAYHGLSLLFFVANLI